MAGCRLCWRPAGALLIAKLDRLVRHVDLLGKLVGFDRIGDQLMPNAAEQRVIARIRRARAAGASLQTIAGALNRDRVPTKTGKAWYASTIKAILGNDLHRASNKEQQAAE